MQRKIFGEILATGSELMLGLLVDTNSAWLSETLGAAGVAVVRHSAVGDDRPRIVEAFKAAWGASPLVVVTGGLGPTEDDLTRVAASEAFGRKLVFHQELADELREHFARRGYTFTDNNLRQVWLPEGCLPVPNALGTAPGFALEQDGRLMVFLPGVPQEMKRMTGDWVLPKIKSLHPGLGCRKVLVLKSAGLGESAVDERVGDLIEAERNPSVGLLASPDMVRVIVAAEGETEAEAESLLAPLQAELEKRLEGHIFARGEESFPQAVAALLKATGLKLTILDAVTQGRLTGLLAPSLAPENWGGAQDMPRQPALAGVLEILRLYAPDIISYLETVKGPARRGADEIRLVVSARPEAETGADGDGLTIECGVHHAFLNEGRPLIKTFKVGGPPGRSLARAASQAAFHLWRVLRTGWPKPADKSGAPPSLPASG